MRSLSIALIVILLLTMLAISCVASSGGYWIPPSSFLTPPPQRTLPPTPPCLDCSSPTPGDPNSATPFVEPFPTLAYLLTQEGVFLPPTLPPATATPEISVVNTSPILYYAQAADTLPAVAVRFGVSPSEITSTEPIPQTGFINPGQLLIIPRRLTNTTSSKHLLPDSEMVYSPSAIGFDATAFAQQAGGYLSTFREWHKSTGMKTGAEIIMRVAIENSVNPRLLLALLEYQSQWVYGNPDTANKREYPLGYVVPREKGLYNQLVWASTQLSIGYYAYREGRLTEIRFSNGVKTRLAPDLNAGTAALQYFFAQLHDSEGWLKALDPDIGFPALHQAMFGNPWTRAQTVEPLFPPGITQPPLILPFTRNWTWSFTGGPHGAWEREGAYAALDFAPGATEAGCNDTNAWALAAASGLVVRTGPGLVVIDLDGDGYEQTGWVLIYLHIAERDRVPLGTWVATGDPIGHPSCEGGYATGTHIHIARKYNGEWVPADGALPFNLGGWIAHAGPIAYKGTLTRNGVTIVACTCSNAASFVTRTDDDP